MTTSFFDRYGPWALVTGASRGLGAEFARQLAERGLNIVLVATNAGLLQSKAAELERGHGVQTRTVALDLSREDILTQLAPTTDPLNVGMLVNNAGVSRVRPFLDHSPDQLVHQLHVNARAGLMLAHHYGAKMAERRRGGIIFLSSGSALHGTAYAANYAGTKAYNLIVAESLWYELGEHGVDVLGLMAGPTRTPGWDANKPKPQRLVGVMDTNSTVAEALGALGRRPSVAAGRFNRFGYFVMGTMMSRAGAVRTLGRSMSRIFGPFDESD
jgi:short-subunit dehydrogenase